MLKKIMFILGLRGSDSGISTTSVEVGDSSKSEPVKKSLVAIKRGEAASRPLSLPPRTVALALGIFINQTFHGLFEYVHIRI